MNFTHQYYMQRCLELAKLGQGKVAPNPLVGCVIVHNNYIIGEGWHKHFGGAHAEVNAIEAVTDKSLLPQSTLYVNLEPCSHFGKTPPCADLLIKHRVAKVVVGMVDPFSKVSGKGIKKLKAAGIEVEVGILEDECKKLNKRFITFVTQQRPYIMLKWAQTLDGFIAPDASKLTTAEFAAQRFITGYTEQVLVHKWRGEEQAILVGKNTALIDNPQLNTRAFKGINPLRIVIDKNALLPQTLNIFNGLQPTIIFTSKQNLLKPNELTEYIPIDFVQNIWPQIFDILYQKNIQSVIVEGGLFTLQSVLETNYWDEARVFTSNKILTEGIKAPRIKGVLTEQAIIGNSQLHIYSNT